MRTVCTMRTLSVDQLKVDGSCIPLPWKEVNPPTLPLWFSKVNELRDMEDLTDTLHNTEEIFQDTWRPWKYFVYRTPIWMNSLPLSKFNPFLALLTLPGKGCSILVCAPAHFFSPHLTPLFFLSFLLLFPFYSSPSSTHQLLESQYAPLCPFSSLLPIYFSVSVCGWQCPSCTLAHSVSESQSKCLLQPFFTFG